MTHRDLRTHALVALFLVSMPFPSLSQTRATKLASKSKAANAARDVRSPVSLTDPVARKLLAIEDELDAAVRARVSPEATFERHLAAQWYSIGPHGDIYNRAQMIAIVKSNSDRIERTELFDVIVRVYGSVAVVTGGPTSNRTAGQTYSTAAQVAGKSSSLNPHCCPCRPSRPSDRGGVLAAGIPLIASFLTAAEESVDRLSTESFRYEHS